MKLHYNKIRYLLLAVPLVLAGLLSNSFNFGAHAIEPQTGTSGTCTWNIDTDGNMVIKPTSGEECMLANSTAESSMSYHPYRSSIITIKFEGKVYANTRARHLFGNMTNLTDIDFTGFDTSNTTDMISMFRNASSLTSLDLSTFDTLNVTRMDSMFSSASSLTSLDLSSFDTSNVTNMGSMFNGTNSLVSLNISSFDTTNTIYMDDFLNKGQSDVLREISLGPKTNLKGSLVGLGIWRQEETGELYRGTAIKKGPGTFIKVSDSVEIIEVPYTVDYRINPIIPKIDSFTTTNPEIFKQNGSSILAEFQLEKVDEYTFPGKLEVLFKDAVSDKYDNTYDLNMTVENIKLYDLDMITNNYDIIYQRILGLDGDDTEDTIILSGTIYLDYDLTSKMPYSNVQANVSMSYDITFNILKDGNPVEGSYLFSAYDLDGDSYRDRGSAYDTSSGRGYGNYSEGVNFYEGFDLDSVIRSEDTILRKIGENRYTGTWKNDPSTVRTEIIIKADARESKFTWTTGGSMNTTLFYKYQPRNIEISKKDQDGNFVAGATLEVSQHGKTRANWQSQLAPEKVWLNPGFYTLKEISAPEGYEKTDEEIEFIVGSDSLLVGNKPASGITLTNQKKPTPPTPPKPDEPDVPDEPDTPDTPDTPETPDAPGEGAEPEGSDPAVPDTGAQSSESNAIAISATSVTICLVAGVALLGFLVKKHPKKS